MENLKLRIKEFDDKMYIPIPKPISRLFGWKTGDLLSVPLHQFSKIEEKDYVTSPDETGEKQVKVKIGKHEPKIVTQEQVIELLEKPTPDMSIYRTTYIKWKGKPYGVKNLWKILLGHDDFNTVTAARYLRVLGFSTYKNESKE